MKFFDRQQPAIEAVEGGMCIGDTSLIFFNAKMFDERYPHYYMMNPVMITFKINDETERLETSELFRQNLIKLSPETVFDVIPTLPNQAIGVVSENMFMTIGNMLQPEGNDNDSPFVPFNDASMQHNKHNSKNLFDIAFPAPSLRQEIQSAMKIL